MADEPTHDADKMAIPDFQLNSGLKVIGIAVFCIVLSFMTLELLITTRLGDIAKDLLDNNIPWLVGGIILALGIGLSCRLGLRKHKK